MIESAAFATSHHHLPQHMGDPFPALASLCLVIKVFKPTP